MLSKTECHACSNTFQAPALNFAACPSCGTSLAIPASELTEEQLAVREAVSELAHIRTASRVRLFAAASVAVAIGVAVAIRDENLTV